jgi:hypothetical protein
MILRGVSPFLREYVLQALEFVVFFESSSGSLLSLRSEAHAVTLSGFAGGEFLPLPASKGRAFPFLLTLDGTPTASAMSLRDTRLPKMGGSFVYDSHT